MIRNDEQLAVVREQLALIEHALEELRREVKNERNFAVLSEGYVDQIAELKAEINAYRPAPKQETASDGEAKRARQRQQT